MILMFTTIEKTLTLVIFSYFLPFFILGHCNISYVWDRSLKLQQQTDKMIQLKKTKILFAFYEFRKGIITKIAFSFTIIAYIIELLYLFSILMFIFLDGYILFLMMALWIICFLYLLESATWFHFKYGVYKPKKK